jgi:hypothetical protein
MPISLASHLSADRVENSILGAISPEFILNLWLSSHLKVANSLVYTGEHFTGPWPTWPDWLEKHLADRWEVMVTWYGQGMPDPAPSSFPDPIPRDAAGDPMWDEGLVMSKERGRHVYLSHVANGLALEMTGKVPWSITGYSGKHLEDLFSTEYWLAYLKPPDTTVEGYYFEELMSPATPAHVMQFFTSNNLLGSNARDTVARLFGWCRILVHYYTIDNNPPDEHAFWGPDAPPIPTSMLINGTNFTGGSQPVFGHYTMGCGGTASFMKSVLRAVNIPVELGTPPCGHVMPLFPTINRALSHGDDPYDRLAWFTEFPGWPVPTLHEYLITLDQWNQWFDPSIDPNVSINNVGRHMGELAVKYQSDWLLDRYCQDAAAGLDHASGQVYDSLKSYYTVVELEALQLWDDLAAKAAATNWCAPAATQPPLPPHPSPRVRPPGVKAR